MADETMQRELNEGSVVTPMRQNTNSTLVIALLALCSCKSEPASHSQPVPELYLDFAGSGGSNTAAQDPIGVCWLTGPNEFVVVGSLAAEPTWGEWSPDCTVDEPYFSSYVEVQFLPTRTAGADKLAGPLTLLSMESWQEFLFAGAAKGDEYLLSLRESEGELFVIFGIAVKTSTIIFADDDVANYAFSSVWTELEAELAAVYSGTTQCTGPGSFGPHQMADAEFDEYVRTPLRKNCGGY